MFGAFSCVYLSVFWVNYRPECGHAYLRGHVTRSTQPVKKWIRNLVNDAFLVSSEYSARKCVIVCLIATNWTQLFHPSLRCTLVVCRSPSRQCRMCLCRIFASFVWHVENRNPAANRIRFEKLPKVFASISFSASFRCPTKLISMETVMNCGRLTALADPIDSG